MSVKILNYFLLYDLRTALQESNMSITDLNTHFGLQLKPNVLNISTGSHRKKEMKKLNIDVFTYNYDTNDRCG